MLLQHQVQHPFQEHGRRCTLRRKHKEEVDHDMVQEEVVVPEQMIHHIQAAIHIMEEVHWGLVDQEEHPPPGGGSRRQCPQQTGGAGFPGGTPPTTPPGLPQSGRHADPWAPLERSPKLSLPSN